MRVRSFAASDLVEKLYRGLADNSVGKIIDSLLRADLIIVDERRSLGIASHWPFDTCGRFLPEHTTAASMPGRLLHHAVVVVTEGESYRTREAKTKGGRPSTTPT